MKKILWLISLFIVSCKKDACSPKAVIETVAEFDLNFGAAADDRARHATITALNHILIAGSFQTETNYTDFYFVETDINGNLMNEKTFGHELDDDATAVIIGNDENILLGGNTTTASGTKDMLLYKLNSDAEILWQKTYGGTNNEELNFILPVENSGYLLVGLTESFGAGSRDAYLIKVDENGNELWSKTYGGFNQEGGNQIISTGDGNYLFFGFTQTFGAGDRDFYLLKINPQGDVIWTKTYGSPNYEESQEIVKVESGGYLLFGHSAAFDLNHDMYSVRINEDGDIVWGETYGGNAHDGGEGALKDSEGNFLLLGRSNSFGNGEQTYLVKTNSGGEMISENTYGSSSDDAGFHVIETPLSYIIIGETKASGNYQMLVKKIPK
ncbi:MAG: hypothetical protein POELPBGB_01522 [Bacteroidia bacterium]|nr:hypothetical protein [Bacteroidia bacterium]